MKGHILIVEDEKDIQSIIKSYLEKSGYNVLAVNDGFKALRVANEMTFNLVILDVMMPGIDGFEVLQQLRDKNDIPIIMLTAKADESDRLKGYDLGADDYMTKPFSPRELVKKVDVLMRRIYPSERGTVLTYGDLELDTASMNASIGGEIIELTHTEYKILYLMLKHVDQILTREQIIEGISETSYEGFDRAIDTHIKRLRSKIESDPKHPKYIRTKYGVGYVLGGDK